MLKQASIGAATVLSLGLLAAGCSEDGDTIVSGGGGLLQNTDATPFSGLTANNLANDGGGLTPNGSDHARWRVEFNCDSPTSDGAYSGDGSALVLFSTANNRVYASHFLAGKLTPPVELEASDRDYGAAIDLASYVLLPLNTANYRAGTTPLAAEVTTVRQNAGNWLILGEFQTKFVQPGQLIDNAATLGKGARRTLGSWVFLKAERTRSLAQSAAVGGVTREFRYGFQRMADEVPAALVSGGIGTAPPNSVMSYGIVSDGLAGEARFGGTGNPHGSTFTDKAHWLRGGLSGAGLQASFDDADYTAGEDVSVLAAVYTQIESSLASAGDSLRRSNLDAASTTGGQAFLRYRSFNLATLSWGTEGRISTGIATNTGLGATEAGTGVYADFRVYNQTLFYRYMDASMRTNSGTSFGADTLEILANRSMIAATRFIDGGNGSSAITSVGTANALDVSTDTFCVSTSGAGVAGAHTTSVPSTTSAVGPSNPAPSYERADFVDITTDLEDARRTIYGPDEGLEEISLFFSLADGTASGTGTTGSGPNADGELAVVAVAKSGPLSTASFVAGTNPLRISGAHATDNQQNTSPSSTTNVQLGDAFADQTVRFVLNRTGRWIAVAFTRLTGVSEGSAFAKDLYLNVYQPFRLVASSTGGSAGGTAATMQSRVLAGGPVIVDSGSLPINAASLNGNQLPVNGFAFQGGARYRGLQSDANVVNLFWEQSDGTGDRRFGARLEVTLNGTSSAPAAPTLGAVTAVEQTFTTKVLGDAAFINANGTPGPSSFDLLELSGTVTSNRFLTCDAGPDLGSATATLGNALVVFTRVDDATNTDGGANDLGDASVYASTFNGTAFEAPVKIGTTADTNEILAGNLTGSEITLDALIPVHRNGDIAAKPNFPTQSDAGYFVLLFKDREAALTTASGGTTPSVVSGNSSTRLAQFARRIGFVNSAASGGSSAVTAIADRISPSVTNTVGAPFALPNQLDHAQGVTTDAGKVLFCVSNRGVGVLLRFDNQVWFQATSDGKAWLRDGSTGLPNPGLVTNFSSADVAADADFELHCSSDKDGFEGAGMLLFRKQDLQGTTRGFAATRSN